MGGQNGKISDGRTKEVLVPLLLGKDLSQLISLVGALIPYVFVLLYLISVKYHPSLGILALCLSGG